MFNKRLRIVVTGVHGQVARALQDRAGERLDVIAVGRPEFDLGAPTDPTQLFAALRADVIVNAAAYTAVDKAETDREAALAINGAGAGAWPGRRRRSARRSFSFPPIMSSAA